MALKVDKELLDDARKENSQNHSNNSNTNVNPDPNKTGTETNGQTAENKTGSQNSDPEAEKIKNAKTENENSSNSQNANTNNGGASSGPAESNDFKDKFDEYFKGSESIIAGDAISGMIDDLKANFLFIHAKKQGVDLPKEAFLMDEKSKKFASFLIDYAIKNKLFGIIEKYPLLAAGGVIAISGLTSYLFISAMSTKNKENEEMKKKNADLEERLKKWENATNAEYVKDPSDNNQDNPDAVKDLIKNI